MQDRTKACSILGLSEDAVRHEIEDRYSLLVKKYKHLDQDEQPSPGEPIFGTINEAYLFLIGYAPMQKVQFQELNLKEKFQHIRDNYVMEITISLITIFTIFAVGMGINEIYKAFHTGKEDIGVYSPMEFPISEYAGKK
jgi:hypothetical protein